MAPRCDFNRKAAMSEENAGAGFSVNVTAGDDCRCSIEIEVAPQRFRDEQERVLSKMAASVTLPGFRKGKAPRKVLERRFGKYVLALAAEKLIKDVPRHSVEELGGCPENPPHIRRLHIDPFGNVLFCQGISIGNMNFQTLPQIVSTFDAEKHPIIGPLMRGGLKELARTAGFNPGGRYVDACHLCYEMRQDMINRRMYRMILKPLQAYGMEGMD